MSRVLKWTTLSLVLTLVLFCVALVAAGGGHGTYIPAKVFFPYSMLVVELWTGSIGYLALALALAQALAYGMSAGLAKHRRNALLVTSTIHVLAVIFCVLLKSDSF